MLAATVSGFDALAFYNLGAFWRSSADPAVCDQGSRATVCVIYTDRSFPAGTTITGAGSLVVANGGVLRAAHNTQSIAINMTGNVTVESGGQIVANLSSLTATNINVQAGGVISADALGHRGGTTWASGEGPGGGGQSCTPGCGTGGGSHGGRGGDPWQSSASGGTTIYGSATDPNDYGSGGGAIWSAGGNGGGLLRITASGTLTINGTVTADGGAGSWPAGGGGAGGSIRLQAATLTGTGIIRARGGNPPSDWEVGGGGGGRIAIHADQLFAGTVAYMGGASGGANEAGQGSFQTIVSSTSAALCDSGTLATTCTVSSVKWLGQNLASGISGANLTIASSGELRHSERKDWISMTLTGTLELNGMIRANVKSLQAGTVWIRSGGSILGNLGGPDAANFPGITGTTTVTVDSGGLINADGAGYEGGESAGVALASGRYRRQPSGAGPGGGQATETGAAGGGGAYGGAGGNGTTAGAPGGAAYGSTTDPSDYGSGGGRGYNGSVNGGNGGGLIRINASGMVTLNGTLSSNGEWGAWAMGGGGAGGTIRVHGGTLAGSGTLRAVGGAGNEAWGSGSGSGGGGRIALTRGGGAAFGGTLQVEGGPLNSGGGGAGGAGTTHQP